MTPNHHAQVTLSFASMICPLLQALYKPFTRLPSRLLYDTSVDGPLLRT